MASSIVIKVPIMKFHNDGKICNKINVLFNLGHDNLRGSTIMTITSLRFKQNDIEIETLLIVTNFIIHKNTRFSN